MTAGQQRPHLPRHTPRRHQGEVLRARQQDGRRRLKVAQGIGCAGPPTTRRSRLFSAKFSEAAEDGGKSMTSRLYQARERFRDPIISQIATTFGTCSKTRP